MSNSIKMINKKLLGIKVPLWLKAIHIFMSCAWFGSVLAVVLIFLFSDDSQPEEIVRYNSQVMEAIDLYIIVPSSVLCYLFGVLISWKTKWDFFKYKWIVFKLVIGTALILFGIFFLGPWILDLNKASGMSEFQLIQMKLGYSMMVQAFIIGVVILISALKPWGRLK